MSERQVRAAVSVDPDARRLLLRDTALDIGRRWFATWRDDLLREGRVVEGGFPGRLAEARALVAASVGPAFAKRRLSAVTDEEIGWAVHATYDEAKRAWLSSR
jgi:hypothetical protein